MSGARKSGAFGLYGFNEEDDVVDDATLLGAAFRFSYCFGTGKFLKAPPGVKFLGLKGAALAVLGERPGSFGVPLLPLVGNVAGVKLGESTLKRFFML